LDFRFEKDTSRILFLVSFQESKFAHELDIMV